MCAESYDRGGGHVHPLAARYDALWDAAAPAVRSGLVTLDAWALHKNGDARRGVALLARPAAPVADALAAFLAELRALEPAQYYHPRADFHLTVLSLFTATSNYAHFLAHVGSYRAAVFEALDGAPAFAVDALGISLTLDAVIAQGFPRDATLARIRERLREALAARGLGAGPDQRYRLETAHTTLVRFVAPLREPGRFVDALAAARGRAFGTSVIARMELVLGDWYQSSDLARTLADYELGASQPQP